MRCALFFMLVLTACAPDDSVEIRGFDDATTSTADGDCFCAFDAGPADADAAIDAGPKFNGGGPLSCLGCTCDGTLYGCVQNAMPDGGCPKGGGPPQPMPIDDDADTDADDGGACEADIFCRQIPVQCLPNPTCDCIGNATGLECAVDPSGNGFLFTCPPPPP